MDEREQVYTDDDVEIVDLDENRLTFSAWRKKTFATFTHHKRTWIHITLVTLCIVLLTSIFQFPVVRNNVWSRVSGIPLDAVSVQVKGRDIYGLRAIDSSTLWHVQLDDKLFGPPQIVNHVIYVLTQSSTFYAIQESNGRLLWQYDYRDFTIYPPVLVQGILYVGSYNGNVKAVGADNGSLLWQRSIRGTITSPLYVSNGAIYFRQNQNTIVALHASDGSDIWRIRMSGSVTSPLLVSDNAMYFNRDQNTIVALRTADGSTLWQTPLKVLSAADGSDPTSQLLQVGDMLIVANITNFITPYEAYLVALHKDGSLIWSLSGNTNPLRAVLLQKNTLYMLFMDGTVEAYDISRGVQLWRHTLGNAFADSMELIDSVLYVNSIIGECIGLRIRDGSWFSFHRFHLRLDVPIVFDHQIYVNTNDIFQNTGIDAINVETGSLVWKSFTLIPLSYPNVVDERVYVTDIQGSVYVLDAERGDLIRKYL